MTHPEYIIGLISIAVIWVVFIGVVGYLLVELVRWLRR